jgi:hypothetical protein
MNELFNVDVEEKDHRKGAFAWFHKKKISSAKALAIGVASIVALSAPVVLFASRNNSPTASVDTTVISGDYVTTTTLVGASQTTLVSRNSKKVKGSKLPGLVLPTRGSAATGATSTTLAGEEPSTSTSIAVPPAPPIVLSTTTTTIAPGSISRTISFASTTEIKTYGDSSFTVSATATIGSGDITYTSSNSAVCTVDVTSGQVSIVGAGSCDISAAIPASGTYAPANSSVPVSVIVNKASLTITASSASIAYSPRLYVVTASYTGFVNGEDSGALTTLPTCAVRIPGGFDISSVDRRTYATSCSGAVAPNYDISYVGGVLSVSNWS